MIEISEIETTDQSASHSNILRVDKISCHDLSYEQFHHNYMNQNVPLIIESIPLEWRSMQTWIKSTVDPTLDFECLKHDIPDHKVPIADCTKELLNSHEKFEINFHDFLDYWAQLMVTEPTCDDKLWYLKDWHLRKIQPSYDFYETPKYFASDWLNEYLHRCDLDDYKFVYMGPKGTWTPFHADVFGSFSWSTNIFGVKKWFLIYPTEETKLLDKFNNLPFHITEEMLERANCNYICLQQRAGDTIFVPSGWYHQVHNVDHTISINHNFFNGCNVSHIWTGLFDSYRKVLKEIDDCRDMDGFERHCQVMLKALHGMNFEDFFDLLSVIVDRRIEILRTERHLELGRNLCLFDLKSCLCVLQKVELNCNELNFGAKTLDVCERLKRLINEELRST